MMDWTAVGDLEIATILHDFINDEARPNAGIEPDALRLGLSAILAGLTPCHRERLAVRDELQTSIDAWHEQHKRRGLLGRHRPCRSENLEHRRSTIGRVGHQCPLWRAP